MENDLKILKVEYLSNYRSDFPQISNLGPGDQIKIEKFEMRTTSSGRRPPMENDLKILNVEYLSNH